MATRARTVLIFDLDGTISDPAVGIRRSIDYALAACGQTAPVSREVSRYIGPPLDEVFRDLAPGASEEAIRGMVDRYRERYAEVGHSENEVYAGIPEALAQLAARGVPMGVCTSKRADFAEQILALFSLRGYFAFVTGADIGTAKREQLRTLPEQGVVRCDSMMIGDRAVDMAAARANGLRTVGVLWGHGSEDELRGAAPDYLLRSPTELEGLTRTLIA